MQDQLVAMVTHCHVSTGVQVFPFIHQKLKMSSVYVVFASCMYSGSFSFMGKWNRIHNVTIYNSLLIQNPITALSNYVHNMPLFGCVTPEKRTLTSNIYYMFAAQSAGLLSHNHFKFSAKCCSFSRLQIRERILHTVENCLCRRNYTLRNRPCIFTKPYPRFRVNVHWKNWQDFVWSTIGCSGHNNITVCKRRLAVCYTIHWSISI